MKAKVYRIDRSFIGKVGRKFKKPDLPPMMGGLFGRIARTTRDVLTDDVFILADDAEINRFRDPRGLSLQEDVYYVRHPCELYTRELIPAPEFHPYILRQQTAEMIDYLRENLSIKRIRVDISRGTSLGVSADVLIPPSVSTPPLGLNGSIEYKKVGQQTTELVFKRPLKASEKRKQYGWIDSFPHLVAAVDNVQGEGKITLTESCDLSFGLNVKVAKVIGVSGQWLDKYNWLLEAETA